MLRRPLQELRVVHVVVVGGGIIGVTSAFMLREAGFGVTVVDRARADDGVASNVNAGLITPGHSLGWASPAMLRRLPAVLGNRTPQLRVRAHADPALIRWGLDFIRNCTTARATSSNVARGRLGRRTIEILDRVVPELGLEHRFHSGMVFLHSDEALLDAQMAAFGVLIGDGHDLRRIDRDQLFALEPSLAASDSPIIGAVHHPEGRTADSRLVGKELRDHLAGDGVRFVVDDVVELVRRSGRVTAARTASGELDGDAFVVAAGAHTPKLLPGAVRTYPVRGYGFTWTGLTDDVGPRLGGINETDLIAWSRADDELRVTGIAEFARGSHASNPDDVAQVLGHARRLFPMLEEADAPRIESGFRPVTASGLPVVGRLAENLFVNSGHGNLGWTASFASAEILTAAIQGEPPTPLAQAVAPRV